MASRVNSAWSKLDKYYTKTNESTAYVAAVVLDPRMKWEYISSTWQPEWVTDAKTLVIQRWKKYRPSSSDPTTASSSDSTTIFTIAKELDQNAFITWKHQQSATINGHKEKPQPIFKRKFKYAPTIIYSFSISKPNINTIYIDEKDQII